ncbi:hypothetical protein Tco_0791687 [Tanacetum coccineum]
MDNPNITMEDYIRLEEEKAQKYGKVFNWETAKYGKICFDDDIHDLRSVEIEFPAIVFNDEIWHPYHHESKDTHFLDFQGMPELMRDSLFARMVMEHRDDAGVVVFTSRAWGRLFDTRGPLFQLGGARRRLSWRQFILALGLHTGEEMESLGFARVECWIVCGSIGSAFTAEILRGLTVIAPELPMIDMAELVRLHICKQLDDTWAWVAMGLERQPDAAAGAPRVAQDALVIDDGGQADPAPVQAPPPPPAAARTIPHMMDRLEEDVHEIRGTLAKQREVISVMAHDFSRFYT